MTFVMLIILTGCDQASMIKKMTPPEAESTAQGYIDLLRQNRFAEIEKALDPSIKTTDIRNTLAKMAQMIPAQKADSIKVVGSHVLHGPDISTTNITFEYQFNRNWLLINVATQEKQGISSVVGFNVNPIADSLENTNQFRLVGKTPLQYAVLVLAIIIPLLTLYALVLCVRTRIEKRKWLWVIFIILGVAKFSVDWTTGQWGIMPLSFQLFGASAFAPAYSSWIISISLPLGAAIFMIKRKELSKQQAITEPFELSSSEKEDWLGGIKN